MSEASNTAETFKAGMRQLAGHVCVITSENAAAERVGLTATAVCSVSADPPTLLVCINRQSASHAVIRSAGFFAVNVLALQDRSVADRFASGVGGESRFSVGQWSRGATGAPLLESAMASFDCRIAQAVDVETHGILFGRITAVRVRGDSAKLLLYAHGQYGGFASLPTLNNTESLWIPSWNPESGPQGRS
jgi:flavin reductase (DIM6/NTAB) family NADH-FMN oxidoreductase RutF